MLSKIHWLILGLALMVPAALVNSRQVPLLAVSLGQMPNDTGSDGLTTYAKSPCPQLDVPALKVVFASGDTLGVRMAKVTDWKAFTALHFAVYNPATADAHFTITITHSGTHGYATRIDTAFTLKPGKGEVRFPIAALKNNNGSLPDLANILRWYIANTEKEPVTVFFGDLLLEGDDLTGGATAIKLHGDPAREKRIHDAKMPTITTPVPFDTPQADLILSALEIFPSDNPWNLLVDDWPVSVNSDKIISSIGANKPFRYNSDMGFAIIPPTQARLDLQKVTYVDESDKGPFPIPDGVPIEGWPSNFSRNPALKNLTLESVQRDMKNLGGDRHALVVDPTNRMLYEFYQMKKTDTGWTATQASVFDLKSNTLRPDGWTSTDAAGLPIFPAVVRYDELQRGMVEHAMRVTVRRSRRAYIEPATHYASTLTDPSLPRMGERIRLKKDFNTDGFSPAVQAILKGLKKYGMFVADNGIEWAISVAPDPRIPVMDAELRLLKGSDFEVVEMLK